VDLSAALASASSRTQGLATRAMLRHHGVSDARITRGLASGALVRVRRRVYAAAPLPPLPRFVVTDTGVAAGYVQHVRAVLYSLGAGSAAAGRTAAALYGWGMLVEPSRTVEVVVAHGRGAVSAAGVRVAQRRSALTHGAALLPGVAPLRVTTPVQTVLDCGLALPLIEAVVVCDSALRAGAVTLEELQRAARALPGVRDAAKVRRVLALADPEAGSVLESVLRVHLLLDGIDGWESQLLIRDTPALRVDFAFRVVGLVVEVDGAKWHPDPARDQVRDNALAALGWRVLRYTWADVVHDADRVLAEIRAAVACGAPSLVVGTSLAEAA
jgi:very-short-patch-repair endonuclease